MIVNNQRGVTPRILTMHRALLGRLLPDDDPDDLTVRQGQFHHVVIGSDRVVCFPRTKAAAARLPVRAAVLHAIAGVDIGLRTPVPLSECDGHGTDEPPFLVTTRVPGAPLDSDVLDDPEAAEAVAGQYAALLTSFAHAGANEKLRTAFPHTPQGRWRQFAADVRAELFTFMSNSGRQRAERELAALDSLPHIVESLVHGDLGGENVLWETTGGLPRISGVIDWDEAAFGDPAEDLAAIVAGNGTDLLNRVLDLGGQPDHDLAARIAVIRDTFALQQALYARRDGDEEELADGLTGYR